MIEMENRYAPIHSESPNPINTTTLNQSGLINTEAGSVFRDLNENGLPPARKEN